MIGFSYDSYKKHNVRDKYLDYPNRGQYRPMEKWIDDTPANGPDKHSEKNLMYSMRLGEGSLIIYSDRHTQDWFMVFALADIFDTFLPVKKGNDGVEDAQNLAFSIAYDLLMEKTVAFQESLAAMNRVSAIKEEEEKNQITTEE